MSYTRDSIQHMNARSVADYRATCRIIKGLHKYNARSLDTFFHDQHEEEFQKYVLQFIIL